MDGFFPASFIPELSERMGWILLTAGGAAVMRQGRRNDIGKRRIAGKGREAEAQNEAAEAGFAGRLLHAAARGRKKFSKTRQTFSRILQLMIIHRYGKIT